MASNQDTPISAQIDSLTRRIQKNNVDADDRLKTLSAARGLMTALESPVERIIQDVVMVRYLIYCFLRYFDGSGSFQIKPTCVSES